MVSGAVVAAPRPAIRPAAPRMSAPVQTEATRSGSRLGRKASITASRTCARQPGPRIGETVTGRLLGEIARLPTQWGSQPCFRPLLIISFLVRAVAWG